MLRLHIHLVVLCPRQYTSKCMIKKQMLFPPEALNMNSERILRYKLSKYKETSQCLTPTLPHPRLQHWTQPCIGTLPQLGSGLEPGGLSLRVSYTEVVH